MKTHLESVQNMTPIHMSLGNLLLRMHKVCSCRKNNLYRHSRTKNYNKTRINIGHQHSCWKELMKAFRDQIDDEVPLCMCFGYWDRHNNYAGRQAAYKKQQKYMFFDQISPNNILYSCFEGIY